MTDEELFSVPAGYATTMFDIKGPERQWQLQSYLMDTASES